MARGKKTVTKATHMYQNRRGVESRPEIHKMRRAPTPPTKGHSLSYILPPRKFPMNIQANTDCRSYQYAGLACNAAP